MKTFASEYIRNEKGWILFPTDSTWRHKLYPEEVNSHPAKANMHLVEACIDYVSEPEQTVMDVMAGTGTIMLGALKGRRVVCIEISPKFTKIMQDAMVLFEAQEPGSSTMITIINQACHVILPIPNFADHIIFSPQYAGIMKTKGTDGWNKDTGYDFAEYSRSPLNLGTMSEFLWGMEMSKVYEKCYQSLIANGSMTLIIKDHMNQGERVQLTQRAIDACLKIGFKFDSDEHYKWAAPGMPYTAARRARGETTVDDEDIVILRKGG